MDHVSAIFETRYESEQALGQLEAIGVMESQISVITTDDARGRHFGFIKGSKAEEGATAGATIGGLAGAVIAAIASAGAVAIPGLNVVVSGYLISAVAGLGAGAATGGILGALVGFGFPEHEARLYEDALKGGKILLAVKPRDTAQRKRAKEILDQAQDDENMAHRSRRSSGRDSAGIRT